MKRITLALLATAGFAASSVRADHNRVSVSGHISIGSPVYVAPASDYCPPAPVAHYVPARGHWKEVVVKAWIPERWVSTRDRWGRRVRICEPGHYAYHTERVWVDDRAHREDHRYSYRGDRYRR